MAEIYGCDIGNGFGFISLLDSDRRDPKPMLPIPRNPRDMNVNEGMPTEAYVAQNGADIFVYDPDRGPAARKIRRDPAGAIRAVKTRLQEESIRLQGRTAPVSPYDVYGAVTRDLIRLGNQQRAQDHLDPIYEMVMTYPAFFATYGKGLEMLNRMQASIQKVELDGHHLKVAGRLPEPAAVAIDYLYYLQHEAPKGHRLSGEEFTAVVYDLGHGTFDTAVVTARSSGEPYQVWDVDGLSDVGGKDFDARLLQELTEMLSREHDYKLVNDQDREDLLQEAITAKHELSDQEETVVQHQNHRDGSYLELCLTRTRFEEISRDMLLATLEKTQELIDAHMVSGQTIQAIVLSGGASQMPMVRQTLESCIHPSLPVHLFRPSKAVSFGAARYAAGITEAPAADADPEPDQEPEPAPAPNPVAQLYTKHGYGVLIEDPRKLDGEVRILLDPKTPLPASSNTVDFPCFAGRVDCKVYRPRQQALGVRSLPPEECTNLVWLHFDVPKAGIYQLELSVDANYDVTVTLTRSGLSILTEDPAQHTEDTFRQKRSTSDNRTAKE